MAGEAPLPDSLPCTHNIKSMGAVGDGVANDTAVFRSAMALPDNSVLCIPAGRCVVCSCNAD
jgi:hypothetical protein